ncbi:TOM1-like protein 2 isoform X2 [Lineus longissimus]|uniref:TOM1-like protein 2 isoform X2 n=1 Tax=Lineus longissimus TaxID=88925 RepID=UPI002B4DA283
MANFFQGNPFSTQVGQLIEKGTDGTQDSENWALFMEVCDIINETTDGPKDAIRAIKKRLNNNVKNSLVLHYTLTLLETCVKNCGKRFHVQVANKDFLHDIVKIIGPKNNPSEQVQEKVLSLIQTWADAFRGQPDLKEVEKTYADLKSKGIEFPMTDLDALAPIHTPARSVPEPEQPAYQPPQQPVSPQHQQVAPQQRPQGQGQPPTMMSTGPVNPSAEQLAKLRSELDVVQGNLKVFGEMLTEMTPGQEDPSDLELLQELNRTCRQMQQRIVELLDRVANEEVTGELLRVNDDLNNMFIRYERFERYRTGNPGQTPDNEDEKEYPPPTTVAPPPPYSAAMMTNEAPPLIDLGSEGQQTNELTSQLAGMNLSGGSVSGTLGQMPTMAATNSSPSNNLLDEFDMFAASRQSFDQNKPMNVTSVYSNQEQPHEVHTGISSAVNAKNQNYGNNLLDNERDLDEMDDWVQKDKEIPGQDEEGVTSAEFDKFLAERASVVDTLPDVPDHDPTPGGNVPPRPNRQLQKEDQENAMFAL